MTEINPHSSNKSPLVLEEKDLGLVGGTALRFNLVRRAESETTARDVIIEHEVNGYGRLLLVSPDETDMELYDQLTGARIPQLPLLGGVEVEGHPRLVFGIRDGLKPLSHEAFFARESSETYISDREVFTQVGKVYRDAWVATHRMMLDPANPHDSVFNHIAIHSFADNTGYLYLCPPYAKELPEVDYEEATAKFKLGIENGLQAYPSSPTDFEYLQELAQAASEAFTGEM